MYGLSRKAASKSAPTPIAIWDPGKRVTLTAAMMKDNVGYTPYEGMTVTGWPTTAFQGKFDRSRRKADWLRKAAANSWRAAYRHDRRGEAARRSRGDTEEAHRMRKLKIAAAQLGPLHRADSRSVAVSRLVNLMRQAHGMGAKFVVFPELALTTFFPRWWMEDQAEVDRRYFESTVPSKETAALFEEARKLRIGFYVGYAELTAERGGSIPRSWSGPTAGSWASTARCTCRGMPTTSPRRRSSTSRRSTKKWATSAFVWRFMDTITGMLICNDRRWPEAFRVLALQGAEIVALGFNTPTENLHYPEPLAARAPPSHHGAVDGVPERGLAGRDSGAATRTASACSATRSSSRPPARSRSRARPRRTR